MLKCETNTPEMEARIMAAWDVSPEAEDLVTRYDGEVWSSLAFEHGQWWVVASNGASYAVNDATGPGTVDGFEFELVSEGEE